MGDVLETSTKPLLRRVTRGDFGPVVDRSEQYPRKGSKKILQQLKQYMRNNQYCNPDLPGLAIRDPEIDALPREQRCLAVFEKETARLAQNIQIDDKRFIHLPSVGEDTFADPNIFPPPHMLLDENGYFVARTFVAKKCLDKARQLFSSGTAIIIHGLSSQLPRERGYYQKIGSYMHYQVQGESNIKMQQSPKIGKVSALWRLYQAYIRIRDYEMNPLPPTLPDGTLNPQRIEEDKYYQLIMGTYRMLPNRLAVGKQVALQLYEQGFFDQNYYNPFYYNPNIVSTETEPKLYQQITEQDSMKVLAINDYWKIHQQSGNERQWITDDADILNAVYKIPLRKERPDTALALENIHKFFLDPLVRYIAGPFVQETTDTSLPPQQLSVRAYALLGQPYPENANPFFEYNPMSEEVIAPLYDYNPPLKVEETFPIFFPSGKPWSVSSVISLPFSEHAPPSETGIPLAQIVATPTIGPPASPIWDARQAAAFLMSQTAKLEELAFLSQAQREEEYNKALIANAEEYGEQVNKKASSFTYWQDGKRIPIKGTPESVTTYSTEKGRVVQTANKTRRAPPQSYDVVPLLYYTPNREQREGIPTTLNIDNIDTIDNNKILYPYGMPSVLLPKQTDVSLLPREANQKMALLQHALFLLNAPRNEWQMKYLTERLWNSPPMFVNTQPGSNQYGHSAFGKGLTRRNNQNITIPNSKGWSTYVNPFELLPIGGIMGRLNADQLQPNLEGFRTNGVPIGPFDLDPLFGQNPQHTPSLNYHPNEQFPDIVIKNIWVIRTNQVQVAGENTWGLDFY